MGKKFLIDTNVLVDFQRQILPEPSYAYVVDIIDKDFTISFVSLIEFLGYKDASPAMQEFIKLANVIGIDRDVINETIELRKVKSIKLPDAIIAGTAIANDMVLISRNLRDFKNIPNLEVIDPYQLGS